MKSLPTAVLMAMVLGAAACAQDPEAGPPATGPADYLASVEELLAPPSRLASVTAERLADSEAPIVDVAPLAAAARRERAEFGALRLESPLLRRQRDRLADGYADVIRVIDPLVAAHGAEDPRILAIAARPFYDALQALPSSVPPPDAP